MNPRRRALIAAPLVLLLGAFVWLGMQALRADLIATRAMSDLASWDASGGIAGDRNWKAARQALEEASALTPSDPTLRQILGTVSARGAVRAEDFSQAFVSLRRSLEVRPVFPYTWAALAEARYRSGAVDQVFRTGIVNASSLGTWEPEVEEVVAFYGLAAWAELDQSGRAAVERVVAAGMKHNPVQMLRISERRGRLSVACRHVSETSRIPERWAKLCNSTEARS